jgi:uncharacterized cupin superfamily protein
VTLANLFHPELEPEDASDPPGYRVRGEQLGKAAGSQRLGASLYEIPPGNSICPYHWHSANEEMLIVLSGTPTLRTPEGERRLAEGDVVAFPVGERGAHKVTNDSPAPLRVLMISEMNAPEVGVYPDSGKVMARQQPPGTPATGLRAIFRLEDGVDYWEGEGRGGSDEP